MADSLLPVKERIVLDVCKTLEGISDAAGYSYTLEVERPNPSIGNHVRNNLAVVVQGNPARISDGDDDANGYTHWHLPIEVVCTVVESKNSEEAIDARLNIIAADVEKALCQEGAHDRGGIALDTWVIDPEQAAMEYDAHMGQIIVRVIVHFRHRSGDPYSQQ